MDEIKEYKTSEAKRRGNAKYDKKNFKTLGYKCRLTELDKITEYATKQHINSISNLIGQCINYCIDNNIDLSGNTDNK